MLANQTVKAFATASDPISAKQFYGEKLGLKLLSEDGYGLEFELKDALLRISLVSPDHGEPQKYTVVGWSVSDILETLNFLKGRGIVFERYDFLQQDENGIWAAPGGTKVAWFKDNHGNLLSIDQRP
jgi:predicted enzyme related to lactoylglutathione lyase